MSPDAFAWVGTVLLIAFTLPQVYRSCVLGRTAGVPVNRPVVAIVVAVVWLGYGIFGGGPEQVVLNATVVVLNVALLVRLAGRDLSVAWSPVLVTVATLVVGSLFGKAPLGIIGAVIGSAVSLPQLLALREEGADVDGVSAASLWMQGAGALCWLVYGALRAEVVVIAPNVFVIAAVAATLKLLRPAGLSLDEEPAVLAEA